MIEKWNKSQNIPIPFIIVSNVGENKKRLIEEFEHTTGLNLPEVQRTVF